VSEDRLSLGLVQPQSIADNTAVTVLNDLTNSIGLLSPTKEESLVDHWIKRFSVKIGHPDDPVSTLSGGNQQRIVLAKWLATKPKLLVLDSPTVGVDVGARNGIFEIVRELAAEGMAILLISDETPEVYFNSDRILHMRDGAIIAEYVPGRTPMEKIEEEIHA
jgi:simple sugar transport system ATP-binding protein